MMNKTTTKDLIGFMRSFTDTDQAVYTKETNDEEIRRSLNDIYGKENKNED